MTHPRLALVVAVARNGVIGDDNRLVWRLKTDLKRFRALTIGKPIVMGRKTFQSIGKPLPGRETIVLTRDPAFAGDVAGLPGVHVAGSLDEALSIGRETAARMGATQVMCVGGGDVYRQAMPYADAIHVTEVMAEPKGDVVFPEIDHTLFREIARERHDAGHDDEFPFSFVDYVRR